jgi:Biotin-lipoyl like
MPQPTTTDPQRRKPMNILAPDSIPGTNKMSQGSLVEIAEHKSVPPKAGKRKRKFLFLAGAVVLIVLAVIGVEVRSSRTEAVRQGSQQAAEVTVVHPQKAAITIPVLPGQTEAYTDAPIYAQTSGYLKNWYFDIGAKVKAGDVLAEIDTPEVDQQLAQMWIVNLALKRAYTFIVLAIFILIAGVLSILSTMHDSFIGLYLGLGFSMVSIDPRNQPLSLGGVPPVIVTEIIQQNIFLDRHADYIGSQATANDNNKP